MKISHFINEALFHPDRGYYRTKNPIGKNSDFITAPEISQVFGELIAVYILQIISGKKSKIALVEMGAGKGTLLRDILVSIKKLADKKIPQALDFLARTAFNIVEINDVLKKIQQENLKDFSVAWYETFDEFLTRNPPTPLVAEAQFEFGASPPDKGGWGVPRSSEEILFISNELFDCFPIDQFIKTDIGWCERLVDSGRFVTGNFNPEIHQFVEKNLGFEASQKAPFGSVFEYSESAQKFMAQLCEALKNHGGIAINVDYGYAKTEFANTLQAIKNHQKTNVLENVGESDITAHVDFGALDKIAKNFGLNSSLVSQRDFLISLGIEERRKILINENSAIDRLIAPDQMGELFKCHIIWTPS